MKDVETLIERFEREAKAVSAVTRRVSGFDEAVGYVTGLCRQVDFSKGGCRFEEAGEAGCRGRELVVAAPAFSRQNFEALSESCRSAGAVAVERGLRDYPGGVALAVTMADYGVAETGTLILDSSDEEFRLATMLSQIHVAVLPESRMRFSMRDLVEEVGELTSRDGSYVAFITGASRTTDIEMVLVLGVHGPLELHILILEGQ